MNNKKEVIEIKKETVKPDLIGQMNQLQKKYEEKFLNTIHPLLKEYHKTTGNEFEYKIHNEVVIKYNGSYYWVLEEIHGERHSGLWFDEEGCDVLGRKFGGLKDRDYGWFNLIARLCCKYQKEIESKIEFDLKEMMQ